MLSTGIPPALLHSCFISFTLISSLCFKASLVIMFTMLVSRFVSFVSSSPNFVSIHFFCFSNPFLMTSSVEGGRPPNSWKTDDKALPSISVDMTGIPGPPSPLRRRKIRLRYNCAHLRSTKESLTFEYLDISFYWASRRRYWLVLGGTGSVWGSTGSYLVVLGQYGEELVDT